MNRAELDRQLDELQREVPELDRRHATEGDFWSEFSARADAIERAAEHTDDAGHVRQRLATMLDGIGKKLV